VVNTLSDPTGTFIDGPCGLAINLGFFESQIFVSNLLNGSVWRLDVGVDGKRTPHLLSSVSSDFLQG